MSEQKNKKLKSPVISEDDMRELFMKVKNN